MNIFKRIALILSLLICSLVHSGIDEELINDLFYKVISSALGINNSKMDTLICQYGPEFIGELESHQLSAKKARSGIYGPHSTPNYHSYTFMREFEENIKERSCLNIQEKTETRLLNVIEVFNFTLKDGASKTAKIDLSEKDFENAQIIYKLNCPTIAATEPPAPSEPPPPYSFD